MKNTILTLLLTGTLAAAQAAAAQGLQPSAVKPAELKGLSPPPAAAVQPMTLEEMQRKGLVNGTGLPTPETSMFARKQDKEFEERRAAFWKNFFSMGKPNPDAANLIQKKFNENQKNPYK